MPARPTPPGSALAARGRHVDPTSDPARRPPERRPRCPARVLPDGLGLRLIDRFEDHEGFDGIILGETGAPYHLEFTRAAGHRAGRAPSPDNLLVFYLPDPDVWASAVERMRSAGFAPVASFNPYLDAGGATFEDPDGYRVVLQCGAWNA